MRQSFLFFSLISRLPRSTRSTTFLPPLSSNDQNLELEDILNFFFIFVSVLFQVTVATQTGHESPDLAFNPDKMTTDKHCYECKVRYRDPKPQDLVMYLHAWKYKVRFTFSSSFSCVCATMAFVTAWISF